MDEKIKQKLAKILELSKNGIGGEKENATELLHALLKKHNLTMSDIEDNTIDTYWYRYKTNQERKLLNQIICSIMGASHPSYCNMSKKKQVGVNSDLLESIEIKMRFDAYSKALKKETETLYVAFIHKHDIFPSEDEGNGKESDIDTSKVFAMMKGLDEVHLRKAIEGGKR